MMTSCVLKPSVSSEMPLLWPFLGNELRNAEQMSIFIWQKNVTFF